MKCALVAVEPPDDAVHPRVAASFDRSAGEDLADTFRRALARLETERIDAIAHRVVHGGTDFVAPVRIDDAVLQTLARRTELAPLHNPPALLGIRMAHAQLPEVPAVAVFDTAFHATRSRASRLYALPWDMLRAQQLQRYGFHGIAHQSLLESLAAEAGQPPARIDAVTLQLGSGCSACAIARGCSIETSMGFTPLEGLVMSTRCGDLDPGVVLHLVRGGRSADEVERLLNRESGLLGLAGSADLRVVLEHEQQGDPRAQAALALFVRRIVTSVGAYLTLLDGRGALVFGGGIGARSAEIRRRVCEGLTAWGVALDPTRNAAHGPGRISAPGSRGVHAYETDEARVIARAAARTLRAQESRP